MFQFRLPGGLGLWRSISTALVVFLVWHLGQRLIPAIRYTLLPNRHPAVNADALHNTFSNPTLLSVNLVVASVARDDISWTSGLRIPNLNILRYVGDDPFASLRPPVSKSREALMYLTYLSDFYDSLPDITIFVHSDELPWHIEGTLLQNMTFTLSQLDLQQVVRRGYFNLRVTWRAGCPTWINTTKTFDNWDKQEEPYIKEAWAANFGEEPIPSMLGGPCCSQFAVTREAVQRRPREQYRRSMNWLVEANRSDYILGRVWERMWPQLFTGAASDCGEPERRSLCQMYSVCFLTDHELDQYKELWEERERLMEDMSFFRAVWVPERAAAARQRIQAVQNNLERRLSRALMNGNLPAMKAKVLKQSGQ